MASLTHCERDLDRGPSVVGHPSLVVASFRARHRGIGLELDGNLQGILLGITAALIYSVYTIIGGRVMKRNDAVTASIVVIASAACVYFFYNVAAGFFFPKEGIYWVDIAAIAIISTAIAVYAYFHGMKLSGAVNASMLSTFEPVTTMVLASLFLGQHIGWLQMAGTALILSSALLVAFRPSV